MEKRIFTAGMKLGLSLLPNKDRMIGEHIAYLI